MEPQNILNVIHQPLPHKNNPKVEQTTKECFQSILDDLSPASSSVIYTTNNPYTPQTIQNRPSPNRINMVLNKNAVAAYQKAEKLNPTKTESNGWEKYKEDQLLSNPGGDHYYPGINNMAKKPKDQDSFWGRVGKDLSDAGRNIKNFFKDMFFGSKVKYKDSDNQIREEKQKGLIGSIGNFFLDLGSALSFGSWRPDGEASPKGFTERCSFVYSKMKEAVFGDLVQGVTGSVVHMTEDLLFAGWNIVETIPDAIIGNSKKGREITTSLFDNGQVVLDYLTDTLPGGDAWLRVHSADIMNEELPIAHNLNSPEHNKDDDRWKLVRNTPFRKSIETTGSLIMDVLTLKFLGNIRIFNQGRKKPTSPSP